MSAPAPGHEDTDDAIDEAFKTLGTLQSMKGELKNIGGAFYDDIEKITEQFVKNFKKDIANRTGQLLHNLKTDKPEKETLKKLINEFPSSLEYKNDKGQLPIQSTVWHRVGYVPLLAEQGIKYNVGGNDTRGGLLVEDPIIYENINVLQLLVQVRDHSHPMANGTAHLNTMKDLRDMNLLVQDDIKDHDLLFHACGSMGKLRFEYLADWSQDGLKTYKYEGLPIFHSIIKHYDITCDAFQNFLVASLCRHPQDALNLCNIETEEISTILSMEESLPQMCFSHHMLDENTGLLCSESGLYRFDIRVPRSSQSSEPLLGHDLCKSCAVYSATEAESSAYVFGEISVRYKLL